ncbi:MAG: hypothetical protein GY899_01950 [Verrucomicrobiaceae bacterium]|nr:hypothetical protein [Verrucomicrobiaceae bacterium]
MELSFPDFPPTGPWQAYLWYIVFLPLVFRVFLVTGPLFRVVRILAPHGGWAINQVRELPIKGIPLLMLNEVISFVLPPLLAFTVRLVVDPFGWQNWSEVNALSLLLLFIAFVGWTCLDLQRVLRVRRILQGFLSHDFDKLRKRAGMVLGIRGWLKRFGGKSGEGDSPVAAALKGAGVGRFFKRPVLGALLGIGVKAARQGAAALVGRADKVIAERFEKAVSEYNQNLRLILLRDICMSASPLLVLILLPRVTG